MKLTILTPDKQVFNGEVTSVKVPGVVGEFEVLKNHAPLVSLLKGGNVRYIVEDGNNVTFSITNGFIEVLNNDVALLIQGYNKG